MSRNPSYYVQGLGNISPQKTHENSEFLNEISEYNDNILSFVLPEFKDYIHPLKLRRMSRILRVGLCAAKIAAKDANLTMPDAIITASGYGCITDTSKFLEEILQNGEKQLTPTFFMQSTYNSVSGTIAMEMKCNNYNTTYVHRGFAFENALQDALMQLTDAPEKRILLGAFDETNSEQFFISQRTGNHKRTLINNLQLFDTDEQGTLQGEGAAFFVLGTEKTANTYCKFRGVKTIYNPQTASQITEQINALLQENDLNVKDIDVVINGIGGDLRKDAIHKETANTLFAEKTQTAFKHLSGDYATASSFGLWLGAKILHHQFIPDAVKINTAENPSSIRHILLLNHFWGKNCSVMLLSNAE